jgi:hypothetical protein
MLSETKEHKKFLESIPSYRRRVHLMKDKYKGKKCYVISCGPSLMNVDFEKLKEKLKDEMVVCVKQSFDQFKEICDIHIYNCANYKNYDYNGSDALIVESTSFGKILNRKCHFKFHILERRFEESVSTTNEIDKWKMSSVYERPYGPGIMYETVFYTLEQLGVSEIITIGWDNSLKGLSRERVHFYDIMGGDRMQYVQDNDQRTSVPWESLTSEERLTIEAMGNWHEWLKSKGIELKIMSHTNPAPDYIERIPYTFINGE